MPTISDPPLSTPIADKQGRITSFWYEWIVGPSAGAALSLLQAITAAVSQAISPVTLTQQAASIGSTPFPLGTLPGGLYRVTWTLRISQAASVSSSLSVTLQYLCGGISISVSGAAVTNNTTATVQSGTFLLRTDANSPINYSTTYASNGAPSMLYQLDLTLEGPLGS